MKKLTHNEKRALALFKKRNEVDLSDGESKITAQTNNDNKNNNKNNNKKALLALAKEAFIEKKET